MMQICFMQPYTSGAFTTFAFLIYLLGAALLHGLWTLSMLCRLAALPFLRSARARTFLKASWTKTVSTQAHVCANRWRYNLNREAMLANPKYPWMRVDEPSVCCSSLYRDTAAVLLWWPRTDRPKAAFRELSRFIVAEGEPWSNGCSLQSRW